jgi:(p)ppGpp synthase/HD superfamily hydrolase
MTRTNLIAKAIAFATAKHEGQERYDGDPYIVHPIAVAEMIAGVGGTDAMIAAAVLHDTLEDTKTTENELLETFGPEITKLVIQLTDVFTPEAYPDLDRAERNAKETARLAWASAEAQTIKVADIIHNRAGILKYKPKHAPHWLARKAVQLAVLTKAHPANESVVIP